MAADGGPIESDQFASRKQFARSWPVSLRRRAHAVIPGIVAAQKVPTIIFINLSALTSSIRGAANARIFAAACLVEAIDGHQRHASIDTVLRYLAPMMRQ